MSLLATNIASLSHPAPSQLRSLEIADDQPLFEIRYARSGDPVPVAHGASGDRALHSLFDPRREGERAARVSAGPPAATGAASIDASAGVSPRGDAVAVRDAAAEGATSSGEAGFVLVAGLGGGYHIEPFLRSETTRHIVIVERDARTVRALLSHIDFRSVLSDPRVRILWDLPPQEIAATVAEQYLPAVDGAFRYLALRSWADLDPSYFGALRDAIERSLQAVSRDYSVQSAFGRRWFFNTVMNAPLLATQHRTPPPFQRVAVVGAGPTLDQQLADLQQYVRGAHGAKNACIVAADTALSSLVARGVEPDYVVSIDCQHVTYLHFRNRLPAATTLVMELGVAPVVARNAAKRLFVAGGHPLSRLFASNLPALPAVDTSGGNVGHAAASFALLLAPSEICTFGLDFAYVGGAAYARGTYIDDILRARENRLRPADQQMCELMYDSGPLERVNSGGVERATNDRMRMYERRFIDVFSRGPVPVLRGRSGTDRHSAEASFWSAAEGGGSAPDGAAHGGQLPRTTPPEAPQMPVWNNAISADDIRRLLRLYADRVAELQSRLGDAAGDPLRNLRAADRETLMTLLPLAAYCRSRADRPGVGREPLLEAVTFADRLLRRTASPDSGSRK